MPPVLYTIDVITTYRLHTLDGKHHAEADTLEGAVEKLEEIVEMNRS